MDNEKVEALMQEMAHQIEGLRVCRENLRKLYEQPAETEEDWIRANLKDGDLVEYTDYSGLSWRVGVIEGTVDESVQPRNVKHPRYIAMVNGNPWSRVRLPRNRWLPHLGGECPVPVWTRVEPFRRKWQSNPTRIIASVASSLDWYWSGTGDDIIAYRIPDDDQS